MILFTYDTENLITLILWCELYEDIIKGKKPEATGESTIYAGLTTRKLQIHLNNPYKSRRKDVIFLWRV